MSDALFQLSVRGLKVDQISNILDDLTKDNPCTFIAEAAKFMYNQKQDLNWRVFNIILIKLADEFKNWLKQVYIDDNCWSAVWASLQKAEDRDTTTSYSDFQLRNDLIYLLENNNSEWLVMFQSLEKKMFEMSHNLCSHQRFHWAFVYLTSVIYLDCNALRHLWSYIKHCSVCQLNQIKRYKSYDSIQLIHLSFISFDTITIDFVMALSEADYLEETVNSLLNVTDKFSKWVLMISDQNTFTAKDWMRVLIRTLQTANWDMPQQILSDCDSKFLSELWTGLFSYLGVKLLLSMAWHPQTDGASERTNQMVEIALQYHIAKHSDISWSETLISLQVIFNNSENVSTEKTSTKLMYSLKVNEDLSLLSVTVSHSDVYNLTQARDLHRRQTQNSQLFASMWAKWQYDMKHKKLDLEKDKLIYLQLHYSYNLLGLHNLKLSNQRADSFKIIKKVSFLMYQLKLPCTIKIYSVISVTHLELCSLRDSYKRPRAEQSPPVLNESEDWQLYEVKKVLDSWQWWYSCEKPITEYLIWWKGYRPEYNEWYSEDLLNRSIETMIDFEQCKRNVKTVLNLQKCLSIILFSHSDQTVSVTSSALISPVSDTAQTMSTAITPSEPMITDTASLVNRSVILMPSTRSDRSQQEKKIWEQSKDRWLRS